MATRICCHEGVLVSYHKNMATKFCCRLQRTKSMHSGRNAKTTSRVAPRWKRRQGPAAEAPMQSAYRTPSRLYGRIADGGIGVAEGSTAAGDSPGQAAGPPPV